MMLEAVHTRHAGTRSDLAHIGKQEPTQCTVAGSTGERQVQLDVTDNAACTTKVVAGAGIAWAKRGALVAPNRTDAAGIYDLDDRERLRSEEHTSELQSRENLVCRLLLEKKKSYIWSH